MNNMSIHSINKIFCKNFEDERRGKNTFSFLFIRLDDTGDEQIDTREFLFFIINLVDIFYDIIKYQYIDLKFF